MSVRSLLALGLVAGSAVASPQWGWNTVTVTREVTKTVTDYYRTVTKTASCSASSSHSTSSSSSFSTTSSHSTSSPTSVSSSHSTTTSTSVSSSHSTSASTSGSTSGSVSGSSSTSASSSSVSSSGSTSGTTTTTSSSASNTNPTTTLLATATATNYGLNDAAKAIGKLWFGTAADIPGAEQSDFYWNQEFNNTHDFGEATPANIMKFEFTEPEQGVFNFTGPQYFLDYAKATGKLVRCHNLIWESELPTWVTNPTVNWTNETLTAVLVNHVTTLIEHFGDQCYSWDVVNEALADSPAGSYETNIWYNTIGPAYVVEAFQAATNAVQANNLSVKLYYNDYNIEYPGAKSTAAQGIVTELKSRGIQIDGVGLESHFIVGETPSQASQTQNMEAFAALGVNVAVTELDVRLTLPANATTEAQQVADYYSTVAACANVTACIGVTVWDFDDTYSWVPSTFAGQGYADLFLQPGGPNTPLVKKAAYDGCLQALTGAPESA